MTLPVVNNEPNEAHHDYEYRIVYRDTDQMGVVYHANYLVMMEMGRVEMLRAKGWSYREMEEAGILIPVLRAECEFRRPALYDDVVRIRTWMDSITRARIRFRYELRVEARSHLVARGSTEHAFMSNERKPIRLTHEMVARLAAPITG